MLKNSKQKKRKMQLHVMTTNRTKLYACIKFNADAMGKVLTTQYP